MATLEDALTHSFLSKLPQDPERDRLADEVRATYQKLQALQLHAREVADQASALIGEVHVEGLSPKRRKLIARRAELDAEARYLPAEVAAAAEAFGAALSQWAMRTHREVARARRKLLEESRPRMKRLQERNVQAETLRAASDTAEQASPLEAEVEEMRTELAPFVEMDREIAACLSAIDLAVRSRFADRDLDGSPVTEAQVKRWAEQVGRQVAA